MVLSLNQLIDMGCGTIAGLALAAAGAGAKEYGNIQSTNAMNSKVAQEMGRQKGYQGQANSVFQNSLSQSTPQSVGQQLGQGQQLAMQATRNATNVPFGSSQAPLPSNLGALAQQQLGATLQNNNQNNAALQGYSNIGLQQGLKDQLAQSQLGLVNTNAGRSASVLPYELQQAQGVGAPWEGAGSLLSAAGMVTGLSGLGAVPASAPVAGQTAGALNEFYGLGAPGMTGSMAGLSVAPTTGAFDAWAPAMQQWGQFDTSWFPGYSNLQ